MPSLYESTVNTGEVSSSNFTTLYNASGLSVPNAGAGQITGNLNVGGNLTVQGSSLLIGEVTLQSTLSLPNYTFPLPDGTTDQVLVTDGNGNLYWTDVNAIPGADYSISATTVTGGANLTLANTAGVTDSVKFASGTNITVTRTDANTITISTIADNIPDGTAKGQVLYWNGSAWTADTTLVFDATANRLRLVNNVTGGVTALDLLKQYTTTLADGSAVGQFFGFTDGGAIVSPTNPIYTHRLISEYDTTANPKYFLQADPVGNFVTGSTTTYNQLRVDNDYLGINGNQYVMLVNETGSPTLDATIRVNRGLSTDATLTWDETQDRWEFNNALEVQGQITGTSNLDLNGNNITLISGSSGVPSQNATIVIDRGSSTDATITWDETDDRWELNNDLLATGLQGGNVQIAMAGLSDNEIYIGGSDLLINTAGGANNIQSNSPIKTSAESMTINSDGGNNDSYLYMKGSTESLKWDDANSRFEFSDQLYISQIDIPAIFERRTTTAEVNPAESKGAVRLLQRVTDAANNDTDDSGPAVVFGRTSGATTATERLFASMGSVWYGTTTKADLQFNWTTDNFTEVSNQYPLSYTLLRLNSDYAEFFNNSLYVDYAHVDSTKTATSITGGNTLVFGSAHGYTAGSRILYQTATTNGLTQSSYYYVIATGLTSTECQVSTTVGGTAVALTNGTGLTLTFASVSNRVGINTDTPGYTLDVDGDANVSGDIYVSGVHVDLSTPVHQGQFLYVSDDVTPTITNSSIIDFADTTYRPNFRASTGIYGRTQSGAILTSNTGAVPFANGDGSSLILSVDSDSQPLTSIGSVSTSYDSGGNHLIRLSTSTNNFASDQATSITGSNTLVFPTAHGFSIGDKLNYAGPTQNGLIENTTYYVIATGFTTTQCQVSLTLGGSAVALTNGTGLALWFYNGVNRLVVATTTSTDLIAPTILLNATNTGIAGVDASLEVERGTSGSNVEILWNETTDRWTTTTDGSTYLNIPNQNLDTTSEVDFSAVDIDTLATINTGTTTTSGPPAVTSISNSNRATQQVMIRITDTVTNEVHVLQALAFRKGTTAYLTTYAEMYSSAALATFTADVLPGTPDVLRIRALPASANQTTFNVVRISLD